MTETNCRKQGFKKCRSATFNIDGFSFTILANEKTDRNPRPVQRFARSKSQTSLRHSGARFEGKDEKRKEKVGNDVDSRNPDEILEEEFLSVDNPDALEKAAIRLRTLVKQLERGEASVSDLKKNLDYAATVLETVYIDETRHLLDTEDELSNIQSESVPSEVRDWLASTFTKQMGLMLKRTEEKPRFRSIVHAVQAGIFVERMYRRTSNMVGLSYPPSVIDVLKNVDKWTFNVFALNQASGEHALKFIVYDLFTRYDLISRFKTQQHTLVSTQLTRLCNEEMSKDSDSQELRALVIEMVLATDMSCHFQQVKAMKNALQQPEGIDKPKAFSLLLHTADISHPTKAWEMHHRWTMALLEEFFRQGDKEAELGLPFSPLCDRNSTMVAQSQIGFIDFIVEPTFSVLTDMTEKIVTPLIEEASRSSASGFRRASVHSISSTEVKRTNLKNILSEGNSSMNSSLLAVDMKNFKSIWSEILQQNREKWKALHAKDTEEKARKEAEEKERAEAQAALEKKGLRIYREQMASQEKENEENKKDWRTSFISNSKKDVSFWKPEKGTGSLSEGRARLMQNGKISIVSAESTDSSQERDQKSAGDLLPQLATRLRVFKRPNYCACKFTPQHKKAQNDSTEATEFVDQRSKMKKLQHISLLYSS
ncbi:dual specificity Calcium/calmodulin-dependent 3',5'-cyclic nucleotide phosphodiesterase 1C-like [Rhincodon typus]|uniref:dual specificity Calcium/calmodulin-dependent 3',5'-cyclic nucleotide phosphodiesterase 1C-like n=1 Tax=Rhincodon typus TaxID=259920 RepID=UPI00202E15BC|nr:dual specificity Calcium/calmodulin-dependent 3',5'-cyclic nucleotide phosphodiesterase 1C-like [Rhincodon typus]